jgi:hypothetical protein
MQSRGFRALATLIGGARADAEVHFGAVLRSVSVIDLATTLQALKLMLAHICEPLRVVGSDRLSAAPALKLRGETLEPRGAIASLADLRTERRGLSLHGFPNQA